MPAFPLRSAHRQWWRARWIALPRGLARVAPAANSGSLSRFRTVVVSRRYRQSPVFYDPTPARWPWVLALLLVVAAVAAGAYFRPDLVPVNPLNGFLAQQGAP